MEVRHAVAEEIPDSRVERYRVRSLGELLAVDPDPEPPPELLADVVTQGVPPEPARNRDLLGCRPRRVEELEEEGAAGRPVVRHPELARHGGREPDAIRVDLLARATNHIDGRVRHEAPAHQPTTVAETVRKCRGRRQQQEPRGLDGAGRHHKDAGGDPPLLLVGPGIHGGTYPPGAVDLESL